MTIKIVNMTLSVGRSYVTCNMVIYYCLTLYSDVHIRI